jgi:trigger factor
MPEEEQAIEPKTEQPETVEQETTEEQTPEIKYTATIEEAGPCKKKVSIEVLEETIKNSTDEQYETLRKEAFVPGFRKGRAPRRLLEKRFGKEATEQIKLKLLADASEAAIKDNKLDVLGEPDIDFEKIELPETGPLKFDFEIEVRPEIDLPPLEGIPVTKTKLEVTDKLVDGEIERLRKWSGLWTPREGGAVELEDQIIADVILKAEGIEEEQKLDNAEIHVRKNGFVGGISVEKLDELLVGAKAGDVKKTNVEVPKTYFKEEFRGKKIDIQINIKEIKWLKPAELDDNFLKKLEVKDEKELRDKIHDMLHGRLEQQSRTELTEQIYKYLLDNTNFDLPLDIVAAHSATLLKRQYVNLLMRGLPRQQVEENMEQLRASSEEQAKQQFKTFFIIDKVAEKLGIETSEEEINGQIAQLAIQQGRRPERMREEMERDGSLAQFKLQIHEKKCIDKLLESASVTEQTEKKAAKKAATKRKSKSTKKAAKEKEK